MERDQDAGSMLTAPMSLTAGGELFAKSQIAKGYDSQLRTSVSNRCPVLKTVGRRGILIVI